MKRLSNRQYQWGAMLSMTAYVALVLLVWPLAREVDGLVFKLLLALTPVLPMLYLFALMARRIRDSDELQQRMHLVALGIATLITGAWSLVGGFLSAAHVLTLDGSILIWVFPVMLASYDVARMILVRRYGGDMLACDADASVPMHVRTFVAAILMAAIAVFAHVKHDDLAWGMFTGMALVFVAFGVLLLIRRRRRSRASQGRDDAVASR